MSKDTKFFTVLRGWLVESICLVDAMLDHPNVAGFASPVKGKVKKTSPAPNGPRKKRRYTKRSDFWNKPHPRAKV